MSKNFQFNREHAVESLISVSRDPQKLDDKPALQYVCRSRYKVSLVKFSEMFIKNIFISQEICVCGRSVEPTRINYFKQTDYSCLVAGGQLLEPREGKQLNFRHKIIVRKHLELLSVSSA